MNHCVPDYDPGAGYSLRSSSEQHRPGKPSMPGDEIVELLWQDGQLVMQSQNQRSLFRKSQPSKFNSGIVTEMRALRQQEPEEQLFIQEDEMTSWLHYPLGDEASLDHNFCSEVLYPPLPPPKSPATLTTVETLVNGVTPRPPISPINNFPIFSGHKPRANATGQSSSKSAAMESTMVGSNDTPVVEPISPGNRHVGGRKINGGRVAGPSSNSGGAITMTAHEVSLTYSSGVSRTSTEPTSGTPAPGCRKRKAGETEATEFPNEAADFDFRDTKKQGRRMTSTKRARAIEVHNQSERRRRDRINEKMKALQELIPRCTKTDKASMLDEAIDYLKSLQLQVQMMSMGCGMIPMMYPNVQHFMPNIGMGMGINRPIMPYPNMFASSALPRPPGAALLGPGYPMAPFPVHPIPNSDPYQTPHPNKSDPMLGSVGSRSINQPGVSNFVENYPHFHGPNQIQIDRGLCSRNQCSSKGS